MGQNTKPLTSKALKFCDEYAKDYNATRAAKDAGYSERTASQQACNLLKDERVQERLAVILAEQRERTQTDADKIVEEYAKIGFSNIQSLLDKSDKFKRIIDLEPHVAACIKKVKETEVRSGIGEDQQIRIIREIELYDKLSALTSLGNHFRIFDKEGIGSPEDIEVNVNIVRKNQAANDT